MAPHPPEGQVDPSFPSYVNILGYEDIEWGHPPSSHKAPVSVYSMISPKDMRLVSMKQLFSFSVVVKLELQLERDFWGYKKMAC